MHKALFALSLMPLAVAVQGWVVGMMCGLPVVPFWVVLELGAAQGVGAVLLGRYVLCKLYDHKIGRYVSGWEHLFAPLTVMLIGAAIYAIGGPP